MEFGMNWNAEREIKQKIYLLKDLLIEEDDFADFLLSVDKYIKILNKKFTDIIIKSNINMDSVDIPKLKKGLILELIEESAKSILEDE